MENKNYKIDMPTHVLLLLFVLEYIILFGYIRPRNIQIFYQVKRKEILSDSFCSVCSFRFILFFGTLKRLS